MSWIDISLKDHIHIKHGFAFKGEFFTESGKYIVLTPGNFNEEGGFRIRPGKDRYYSGDIPEGFILNDGDLIIAMTEQGPGLLGSSAIIPEADKYLHNQRLGLVDFVDTTILDKSFLYYLFHTRNVRGQISGSASGTKVRHTAPERIYNVKVSIPSVSSQQRIASILSAYDDLIENNRRRIKLLEESARLLYREWFVNLRFPGHEHVKIRDGVPEGWERVSVYDAIDILSGGTPKTSVADYWNGEIPFYTPKDSTDFTWVTGCERTITELGLKNCNSQLYPKGTVFISARGTVGKLNIAQRPMAMSQSCYALQSKGDISQYFVYSSVLAAVDKLKAQAVGSVFDAIVVDTFKRLEILIPSHNIREAFEALISPVYYQIELLILRNEKLQKARDLLLPRLMSGEVSV